MFGGGIEFAVGTVGRGRRSRAEESEWTGGKWLEGGRGNKGNVENEMRPEN